MIKTNALLEEIRDAAGQICKKPESVVLKHHCSRLVKSTEGLLNHWGAIQNYYDEETKKARDKIDEFWREVLSTRYPELAQNLKLWNFDRLHRHARLQYYVVLAAAAGSEYHMVRGDLDALCSALLRVATAKLATARVLAPVTHAAEGSRAPFALKQTAPIAAGKPHLDVIVGGRT